MSRKPKSLAQTLASHIDYMLGGDRRYPVDRVDALLVNGHIVKIYGCDLPQDDEPFIYINGDGETYDEGGHLLPESYLNPAFVVLLTDGPSAPKK